MTSGLSRTGLALLTTFGLGSLRPAPGTWGSMPPVALAGLFFAALLVSGGEGWSTPLWIAYHAVLVLIIAVFSFACVRYGDAAEAHFNKKDPGSICADETAGVCIPLMFLPAASVSTWPRLILTMALVFLAFRIFDIIKLPPARGLQKHAAGVGVLLDDLVAGVQALVVVQLIVRLAM